MRSILNRAGQMLTPNIGNNAMPNTAGSAVGYDAAPTGTMVEGSIAGDRYETETSAISPIEHEAGITNEGERLRHSGY